MFQSINICSSCSQAMIFIVSFDIKLCYTCFIKSKKQMSDNDFFDKYPQPTELVRSICIHPSERENDDQFLQELNIPEIKRCTAIDNCKNDPVILKKNEDLYVSYELGSYEIRSSITFEMVPNYRYNEITKRIEKIDPTIEEEDRRLIVLQRNSNAILKEDSERNIK